ncbi:MAG: T9SS type A sorting domain-containing protein [Bacteroidota bacterium]
MFNAKNGWIVLVLVVLFLALPNRSEACDRSFITLDSVAGTPGCYDIYITLCIGGGVTGTQKGGEGDTRTYAFGFYGGSNLEVKAYTPTSLAGDSTGTPVFGIVDSTGFFGTQFTVAYIDPGFVTPFICVNSTSTCGNEHSQCNQYRFTVNELAVDSVRVFGAEGSGNPLAGCYPDPDMAVTFNTLDLEWNYFTAEAIRNDVELQWGISDYDDGKYEVLRGTDAFALLPVQQIEATNGRMEYRTRDMGLSAGTYFYQIQHTSLNGTVSGSEISQVEVTGSSAFTVAPSVVSERTTLRFFAAQSARRTVKVFDSQGQELLRKEISAVAGSNEMELDVTGLPSGVYLVELKGGSSSNVQRIVRM